jgi:hypothetical protein
MSQIHCKESSQKYSLLSQISDIVIKPLKIEKKQIYRGDKTRPQTW